MMRRIALLLALVVVALAGTRVSQAAEFKWEHFDAAPFAKDRATALQFLPGVLRDEGFGLSPVCVDTALAATKAAGHLEHINVGDHFAVMMSAHMARLPRRCGRLRARAQRHRLCGDGRDVGVRLRRKALQDRPPRDLQQLAALLVPSDAGGRSLKCPNGYQLVAHAWAIDSLSPDLRDKAERLISAAKVRDKRNLTAYREDDVSRTLGGRLRREVDTHYPISVDLPVQYLDPKTGTFVSDAGVIHLVQGIGQLVLSGDPRQWIIESVWPPDFKSPNVSEDGGLLRIFRTNGPTGARSISTESSPNSDVHRGAHVRLDGSPLPGTSQAEAFRKSDSLHATALSHHGSNYFHTARALARLRAELSRTSFP